MYDCHLHTNYSFDGKNTMAEICEASLKNGMKGICFTDHIDFDAPDFANPQSQETLDLKIDMPAYKEEFAKTKAIYGDRLEMGLGVEMGLQPKVSSRNLGVLANHNPDFVIGSVHCIQGADIYSGNFSAGKNQVDTYLEFLEATYGLINGHSYFDVLGHFDMILRDKTFEDRTFDRAEYYLLIDDILTFLIKTGRGIEVNSSGWRYNLGGPHPSFKVIKRFKELGGKIITIGSDSHYPHSINQDIAQATDLVKAAGFNQVSFYLNRLESKRDI